MCCSAMNRKEQFILVLLMLIGAPSFLVTNADTKSEHSQMVEEKKYNERLMTTETLFNEVLQWGVQNKIISENQKEKLAKEYINRFENLRNYTGTMLLFV